MILGQLRRPSAFLTSLIHCATLTAHHLIHFCCNHVSVAFQRKAGAFQAYLFSGKDTRCYLFSQRTGKPWSYEGIRDKWRKARDSAGIANANLHDLRAKSLTEASKQGHDAQKLAGHTSKAMTERYIRDRELEVAKPPTFSQMR